MAPLYADHRLRNLWRAFAAAGTLLCLLPAHAASDKRETSEWIFNGKDTTLDDTAGTVSTSELMLREGSTLLSASKADASGIVGGNFGSGTWKLTGAVHLEFEGKVLDTQLATVTVVLANGRMQIVQVEPTSAQLPPQQKGPVHFEFNGAVLDARTATVIFVDGGMKSVEAQGAPAQFSHQFKGRAHRFYGQAEKIEYDAVTTVTRVSGNTSYTYGSTVGTTQELTYNLDSGVLYSPTILSGTHRSDSEKVPAPRTPDRSSAK